MKKILIFLIAGILTALVSFSFADTNDGNAFTIKLYGGYNMWILGSAIVPSGFSSISAGGLSFGGDVLYGNLKGIQFGLEAAYLPIFYASFSNAAVSISVIPVSADIVFNSGVFYTDLGLGMAFLSASANASSGFTNFSAPAPAFFFKAGIGLNFKLSEMFGIDAGLCAYLPFGDFGIANSSSAIVNMIVFSQFNIRIGVCINI